MLLSLAEHVFISSPQLFRIEHNSNSGFPGLITQHKVFVPFFLTEDHAMRAYWGSGGVAPLIL
jgi:hypothetical protein